MRRFCINREKVEDLKSDSSNWMLACFNDTNPDYAEAVSRRIKMAVTPAMIGPKLPPKPPEQIDLADIPEDEVKWFGLGDLVAAGIKSVGLDKLSEIYTKVTGKSCGCVERKNLMNKVKLWRAKGES